MGLRDRVKKVFKATEPPYHTLVLPDGEEVRYTSDDWFKALRSASRGEKDHWLVNAVCRADVWEGPLGLIHAMHASHKRRGSEEEPH